MDLKTLKESIPRLLGKYKYVCLILLAGLFLMSLPSGEEKKQVNTAVPAVTDDWNITDELQQILSQIEGVGKVKVLLTEASGEETVYQTDEDISPDGSVRRESVILSDASRSQSGLIRTVSPPSYLGAIIVCQGAERPAVRLAVVQAVANVTGISSDRISVLKMK